ALSAQASVIRCQEKSAMGMRAVRAIVVAIGLGAELAGGSVAWTAAQAQRAAALDLLNGPADDWPTIGGNLGQTRFSRLTHITTSNVKNLQLAWTTAFDGDVVNQVETELIVSNGVMYLVTGNGNVVAADATSGRKLWLWNTFDEPRPASTNAPIRGLALGEG